eukprot:1120096_1
MATPQEINKFEALGEFFKRLRQDCELQGNHFKQQIRDDSALKAKYTRFSNLATKIKEYKRIQQEEKAKASTKEKAEETTSIYVRKSRKRRYSEFEDSATTNPRKKLKRCNRNNIGFSPSFGFNPHHKPNGDCDKENNDLQPKEPRPTMPNTNSNTLSLQTPSTRNTARNRRLLSNRTSLKNRINVKTQQNDHIGQSAENLHHDGPQMKDKCDDDGDIFIPENEDYVASNRNNAKTPKAKKERKKKKKNLRKMAQTTKPKTKVTRKTVKKKRNASKTSKKSQTAKRRTKKDGDTVSKNFVKMDLKHTRYKRKGRSNRPSKYKKKKFSKYEWKKQQAEERAKKNNFNLENLDHLKLEVYSDSDQEDIDVKNTNKTNEKEEEKAEANPYSERLDVVNDIQNNSEIDDLLRDVLQKEYGYDEYRTGQKEAIKLILQRKSVLLLLSTGAGKSICYQIPTILWKNDDLKPLTLVISPLKSLMRDQCDNLPKCLKGRVWDSSLNRNQIFCLRKDVVNGNINVLFIAPEKLDNNYFQSFLKNTIGSRRLMFACIDEAHCISEWSHNFRPSYLKLKRILMDKLNVGCILACTATATVITQNSISKNLNIDSNHVINALAPRENLHLTVSHIGRGLNKQQKLFDLLKSERFCNLRSLIVYVGTRSEVTQVVLKLKMLKRYNGYTEVDGYHGGMPDKVREEVQDGFMRGEIHIIVGTIAFGMGLNKSDVRGVIHYSVPKSMEHYVQEVGRAGRDGLGSECHVFYDQEDIVRQRSWIHKNGVDLTQIKQLLFDIFSATSVTRLKNRLKKEKQQKTAKIFHKRKRKRKDECGDFSDEDIDDIEDDLILTEFKQVGDIVTISKTPEIERKYDAEKTILSTIFTYFDVYKSDYIVQLPCHSDKITIGLTKKEVEKESEIIKFIVNRYNPRNGNYSIRLGKLYNDLRHIEIEDEEGDIINIEKEYTVYEISRHLKDLEYHRKLTLKHEDPSMVLMVKKQIADHDELVSVCSEVFEYLSKHETSDLEKINTLAQALKIIANTDAGIDCMEQDDDDEEDGEAMDKNRKSINLHEMVEQYFECENHDAFLDLVQSYLPSYDHIRTQPVSKSNVMYAEVKKSVEQFVCEYPNIQRARSIAKIFHGFASPRYPYQTLQTNRFNKKHIAFPFMQIMQIVKEVMMAKQSKKKKKYRDSKINNIWAIIIVGTNCLKKRKSRQTGKKKKPLQKKKNRNSVV